jgi:Peptidase M50B-like
MVTTTEASGTFGRALAAGRPVSERNLFLALLAILVLWNVPYGWVALYPFKLFATWLHELSHGLVMLITGAGLDRLQIFRDTSGLAHSERGVGVLAQACIASAGYLGTATFGALFLVTGGTARRSRFVLLGLGLALAASAALWVRNPFGLAAVLVLALTFAALARFGGDGVVSFVLQFVAAQSCINAVLDIRVLFGSVMMVDGQPAGRSDADTMAQILGGPPLAWAFLWLLYSFALFYLALRFLRRPLVPR